MSDNRILVDALAREWLQDPEFRAEYATLEDEFALAAALIEARARAALSQAQVAERMDQSFPSHPKARGPSPP